MLTESQGCIVVVDQQFYTAALHCFEANQDHPLQYIEAFLLRASSWLCIVRVSVEGIRKGTVYMHASYG